jgi:hypothetical protein
MKKLIGSSELARDVAGAEALLENHQEHRGEIDARNDNFAQTSDAGQRLLDEGLTDQSDAVREYLKNLAEEQSKLNNLWEERRISLEQCMDLQLFYRDTAQAENWMQKQEVCHLTTGRDTVFMTNKCSQQKLVLLKQTGFFKNNGLTRDFFSLSWQMMTWVIHWMR